MEQLLFYGGMMIMGIAVLLAILCVILFRMTGHRLHQRLEQEYGKPIIKG